MQLLVALQNCGHTLWAESIRLSMRFPQDET